MADLSVKKVVETVLDARKANSANADIRDRLAQLGVSASDAPSIIECVESGLKAGTVAAITGGASAVDIQFGQNPVFDAAFRRGKSTMRFTTPGWVLLRLVGPWLLLALIAGIAIYFVAA